MDFFLDFLHSILPDSWFENNLLPETWFGNVHEHYGLTDQEITESVKQASDFFNIDAPMAVHEYWTTGVMTGMTFTENDDILVFNREQLTEMGITDKEGFDLVMTHEGAHRKLQGLDTGFTSHQEELCCDYMAGVRAGLNGMDEEKLGSSLADTSESMTHPDGAARVQTIEAGVAFAHDYMEEHGEAPTFSDCLEDFRKSMICDEDVTQGEEQINLRPEHAYADSDLHEFHHGRYGNATGDYIDDSHPDESHVSFKGIFVDNKATQLHWAQEAKENAEWHEKRSNDAIARGDLSAAKDHAARAASYRKAEQDAIAASKKCTK